LHGFPAKEQTALPANFEQLLRQTKEQFAKKIPKSEGFHPKNERFSLFNNKKSNFCKKQPWMRTDTLFCLKSQ
jgi:hypothetical protein